MLPFPDHSRKVVENHSLLHWWFLLLKEFSFLVSHIPSADEHLSPNELLRIDALDPAGYLFKLIASAVPGLVRIQQLSFLSRTLEALNIGMCCTKETCIHKLRSAIQLILSSNGFYEMLLMAF